MEDRDNLRVTLVQVDLAWENPQMNRQNLERHILMLIGKTDFVILPETFTTGFSMRGTTFAETMDGPTILWLIDLAKSTGLAIGGSLLINADNKFFNRFVFVTPEGFISFYDKRHLFSIGGESSLLTAGDHRQIINYLGWRIALYICYDIRFPVWCRNQEDTDLMIFTANWPDARREVWNTLLKARAIENQVFVAGVNRIGADGEGICYSGQSQLINSKGEVVVQTDFIDEHLFSYTISRRVLNDFRKKFPVANDADRFIIKNIYRPIPCATLSDDHPLQG